jgi:hypothetical protein
MVIPTMPSTIEATANPLVGAGENDAGVTGTAH